MHKISLNPSRFVDMLDEALYATGPERHDLSEEREKLVGWLRKKGKKRPDCLALADKLEACRPKHRCQSAACPECASAGQRLVANVARKFLKAQVGEDAKVVCVTIVPHDGIVKPGKLNEAKHENLTRRWKEKLGKAGVAWFVGATDLSFNEHKQAKHKPRWSEHIGGMMVTGDIKKLKQALGDVFRTTKTIPRPVKVEEWDGNKKALRYMLKPNFWRRIATDNGQRFDKKTGTMRPCRDTDKQPLRSRRKRELLLYLDDIGLQGRLLMRQCQLVNKKPDGPTIVLRTPKGRGRKNG